jgi:hypothetical protein
MLTATALALVVAVGATFAARLSHHREHHGRHRAS